MHAEDKSFNFLSAPNYYDIPFFQRAYVWDDTNWLELLNNLKDRTRDHFLGSLIFKNEMSHPGAASRYSVIDGQQRLTTLSILLRALYDHIVQHADEYGYDADVLKTCQVKMESLLFVSEGGIRQKLYVKINHSHLDKKAYESVINGELSEGDKWREYADLIDKNSEKISNIIKAYVYFRGQLLNLSQETIDYIWYLLTGNQVKFLVNIDLDTNDNEQAIFDTVNSAGVRLSSSDTIKNLVFQKYVELLRAQNAENIDDEAVQEYERTWEDVFLADEETSRYWDSLRQYGRMRRSNIETFLHSFAVAKEFFNPAVNNMVELPGKYKDTIGAMALEELDTFLTELHDYAVVFEDNFSDTADSYEYPDYVGRLFNICNALELSTFYPYLLQQLYNRKKGTITEENLKSNFFAVERYLILNAICKGSTKNYNNECLQMVSGSKSPQEIMDSCIYISEGNFVNGLRSMTTNRLPTVLLFWIELYQRSTQNVDVKGLKYTYTLEHIMPQKWKQNWSEVPAYDTSGMQVTDADEVERIRSHAIYELGNMTLLNSHLNTAVSNGTFLEKVNGKNGKKGIRNLADLRITKNVIDNNADWDERKIYARTKELEGQIRILWNAESLPVQTDVRIGSGHESRDELRMAFWEKALPVIKERNSHKSFENVNPTKGNWVSGSFGVGGFSIVCTANYDKARVDISLGSRNVDKNKKAFDMLRTHKEEIEDKLGASLTWVRANGYKSSWASYTLSGVSIARRDDWDKMIDFLAEWSNKIREVIVPYLVKEYAPWIHAD